MFPARCLISTNIPYASQSVRNDKFEFLIETMFFSPGNALSIRASARARKKTSALRAGVERNAINPTSSGFPFWKFSVTSIEGAMSDSVRE